MKNFPRIGTGYDNNFDTHGIMERWNSEIMRRKNTEINFKYPAISQILNINI